METFQPVRAETTENYGNGSKEKERNNKIHTPKKMFQEARTHSQAILWTLHFFQVS